jgi:hypothetical protein
MTQVSPTGRPTAMRQVWSDLTRVVLGPWPGLAVPELRDYPTPLRRWTTTGESGSSGTYST